MGTPAKHNLPKWLVCETRANNGCYLGRRREHVPKFQKQPLWQLTVNAERVETFGVAGPEVLAALGSAAVHGNASSGWCIPIHRDCARALVEAGGNLESLVEVGTCYPTSSLRTVITDFYSSLRGWALKLHLPDSQRARHSKRMASKEIRAIDAMIGPVYSTLLNRLGERSPYLGVIEEPFAIVATCSHNGGSMEIGANLRRMPDADLVPGFSVYSKPRSPLAERSPLGFEFLCRPLADGDYASRKLDVIDRCLQLFVEPLLDIFFSLACKGVTAQMHAQNILFEFDDVSATVRRVWVRDMGGVTYAPEFRRERGMEPLFEAVIADTPGASMGLAQQWFARDGKRRRLFDERLMFGHSYDNHISAFWFQLLRGLWGRGVLRFRDLALLQQAIAQQAHNTATRHGFDAAAQLLPRFPAKQGMAAAFIRGMARHPPFRPAAV